MAIGLLSLLPAVGGEQEDAERLCEAGEAAYSKGDLAGAERAWRAALAIQGRLAPDSLNTALA
ncbi:MAG: hypothetical protein HYU66_18750, partial [Armatimonadetes bacterium]|nr:hypothetical protein [Armatimonadota bacterium]